MAVGDEGVAEAGDAALPRLVRRELAWAAPEHASTPLDRAADEGPAFLVRVEDAPGPVRPRRDPLAQHRDGLRLVLGHEPLLLRRDRDRVAATGCEPPLDARNHVDVARQRLAPRLAEPEPVLVDEVELEPVPARRDRPAHCDRQRHALAGRDRVRQLGSRPVPHDRVAALVEPVRGRLHIAGAPRRGARVLDLDLREDERPGPQGRQLAKGPAGGEGAGHSWLV